MISLMPLERIYIKEAGQFLAIKSAKAIENWCAANNIKYILKEVESSCAVSNSWLQ
jgi:hypothetical protein